MANRAKSLMFQGTGSDVGKTVLVAGLCRAFANRGLSVLPFKPQNMSNNAAVADLDQWGGAGEMGRAQWLQAMACRVSPSVHMNPILLKPQSQIGSQVVVQGKVTGSAKAREYQALKQSLMSAVLDSFDKVASASDLVLVEGAGSPAEVNLRASDIANMGFATKADVPVVLVGDIDRGGVIASIVGTHTILPDEDRRMIAGYLINKFRGDVSLFDDGLRIIESFTGWRGFGVVPHLDVVGRLPAEDSVALEQSMANASGGVKIAVPVMGRIANFDDLDPLRLEPGVDLVFVRKGERIPKDAKLVILPGSKSTIADLIEFRENGWEADLRVHVENGGPVIGICGGYQMLGHSVTDPHGIEGSVKEIRGLGLLDVETVLEPEKTVRNASPMSMETGLPLSGYEIHLGVTSGPDCARPMIRLEGRDDGAISSDGLVRGCYLHGLFGTDEYRAHILRQICAETSANGYRDLVDAALDELAARLEMHLDVDGLFALAR